MSTPLLTARDVCKRYGRRSVLEGTEIDIRPGEVVGITGENGAGKSTLIRILAGMLRPDRGEILRPAVLAYAPQAPLLYEQLSPREHFRYFAAARGLNANTWKERGEWLLRFYRFEQWAGERVVNLSEGTKQKLNLALALLPDPQLLLLDEPYSGFEWETYLRFWEHVQQMQSEGKAVLIISHLFFERSRFDRLLEVRDGRLREVECAQVV